jgi:glucose/arabinose dehydrogenase
MVSTCGVVVTGADVVVGGRVVVVVDVVVVVVVGVVVVVEGVAAIVVAGASVVVVVGAGAAEVQAARSTAAEIVMRMNFVRRGPDSDRGAMPRERALSSPSPRVPSMARKPARRIAVPVFVFVLIMIPIAAGAGALPPGGSFLDDDGNVHEGNIEAIAAVSITRGCNPPLNDRFCPANSVRRGEMAAFLNRALHLPAATRDYFVDDDTSIFEDDINRLAEAGITRGCNPPANDRYCPDATVSRGAMAAFLVRGYGYGPGAGSDLFIDDDTSIFENDIDRLGTAEVTQGCDPPGNERFCPDAPVRRDEMASFLSRAEELEPIVPPLRPDLDLSIFASGLSQPVGLVAPDGDDRVFVIEKGGTIRIIESDGTVLAAPFLDIGAKVHNQRERGLLGIAFHPDYPADGRFFIHYSTTGDHHSTISSFTVSGDPDIALTTETVLLSLDQPYANHNGGHLEFGPDGYLYIGFGDGGSGDDPQNRSRNRWSLFGKMLRIDVDSTDPYGIPADNPYVGNTGRDEVWAIGLRNPWRFAFDGNDLYIGDVGQDAREEVDVVELENEGYDFGWSQYEGTRCNTDAAVVNCSTAGITMPVLEYRHPSGNSVTGGRVYRGSDIPHLNGYYFYGDLSGWIRSAIVFDGVAYNDESRKGDLGSVDGLVSFGSDASGELYLISIGGTIYKLIAE